MNLSLIMLLSMIASSTTSLEAMEKENQETAKVSQQLHSSSNIFLTLENELRQEMENFIKENESSESAILLRKKVCDAISIYLSMNDQECKVTNILNKLALYYNNDGINIQLRLAGYDAPNLKSGGISLYDHSNS